MDVTLQPATVAERVTVRGDAQRIARLALARSDLLEERSGWATHLPNATILHLEPLAAEEIGMLIDELLQGGDLSPALRGRISDVGSGNPLFVVEMVKMLRDDGVLDQLFQKYFPEQVNIPSLG